MAPTIAEFVNAIHRKIYSYTINSETLRIELSVAWTDDSSKGKWAHANFDEFDVQERDESLVLEYWAALGGRCKATGLDQYHVFKILGKSRKGYKVQWVGYSEDDYSVESEKKMKDISPVAVVEWKQKNIAEKKLRNGKAAF